MGSVAAARAAARVMTSPRRLWLVRRTTRAGPVCAACSNHVDGTAASGKLAGADSGFRISGATEA